MDVPIRRRLSGIAASVLVVAGLGLVLPQAAHASVDACDVTQNGGQVCIDIHGSGLYVDTIEASGNGPAADYNTCHVELTGPNGLIGNSTAVPCYQETSFTWKPYADEPSGSYCVTFWEYVYSYVDDGEICRTVHS